MYIMPQNYKCDQCGHEFIFGPHDSWATPVITEEEQTDQGIIVHDLPVCPKCWEQFLRANVGLGRCTVDWGGGSYYDRNLKNGF